MTSYELQPAFGSTSAAGPMSVRPAREPSLFGFILFGLGTSAAGSVPPEMVMPQASAQTTAGASLQREAAAGAAINDLRRRSGLTWEQLARLFGVSRRSLHFWASGKQMTPSNEEHLQRVLAVIRRIDRGSATMNRSALLASSDAGEVPLDLLTERNYERVVTLLGPGRGLRGPAPKVANEARTARMPPAPADLVDALQDRIHPASGRLLAAKAIRIPGRK